MKAKFLLATLAVVLLVLLVGNNVYAQNPYTQYEFNAQAFDDSVGYRRFRECGSGTIISFVQSQFKSKFTPGRYYHVKGAGPSQYPNTLWDIYSSSEISGCPSAAPPPQQGMNMKIWADETTIVRGQCTFLRWQSTNATKVELWEKPTNEVAVGGVITVPDASTRKKVVALSGEEKVCPTTTMAYAFAVTNTRGNELPLVGLTIAVTDTLAPPAEPVEPVEPTGRCSEGFAYAPDYSSSGFKVYAAEKNLQCTEYIRTLPVWKDTINWYGNAHEWDDKARQAHVVVDQNPRSGDIAVWEQGCQKASKEFGHVAYVTMVPDPDDIVVNEANWITKDHPEGDGKIHTGISYKVDRSCMSFIHPMSGPAQPNQTPQPVGKCNQYSGFRKWLCSIFNR